MSVYSQPLDAEVSCTYNLTWQNHPPLDNEPEQPCIQMCVDEFSAVHTWTIVVRPVHLVVPSGLGQEVRTFGAVVDETVHLKQAIDRTAQATRSV